VFKISRVRAGFRPAVMLPLVLIIVLAGAAVALAGVAPSRVTGGVYQVIVGQGPGRFTIPTESLGCERTGDRARCTAAVAGKPLVISIQYAGFDSVCRAQHGERMVPCASGLGSAGEGSHTVWISDGLGASQQDRLATPWWRAPNGPGLAAFALVIVLSVVAGLASALLGRRDTEQRRRGLAAFGIGVTGLTLLGASGLLASRFDWAMVVAPTTLFAAAALGAWQYQLGGLGTRRAKGIGATLATACYGSAAAFVFLQHSGFIG
jgi:hypothetical protein